MPFVVQHATNYSAGATTNTVVWPSTPTAGNLLWVMYGANGSLNPTVADGGGAGPFTFRANRAANSLIASMYQRTATGTETSVVATTTGSAFSIMVAMELDQSRISTWWSRGVATPTAPSAVGSPVWYRFTVNHFVQFSQLTNGGVGFVVQNGSGTIGTPSGNIVGDETFYTGVSAPSLSIGYFITDIYTTVTYQRFLETSNTTGSAICFGNTFFGPAPSTGIQALRRRREQP